MVRDRIVIVSTSEPNNPRLACRRRGRQQVLPAVPAAGASPLPGGRDEEVSRFRSSPYGRNLAGLPRPLPARQGLFSGFRSLAELRRASIEARPFFWRCPVRLAGPLVRVLSAGASRRSC